jgi:hypothetical protein
MVIILTVVTVVFCGTTAPSEAGPPGFEDSRSHSDTPHSVRLLWTRTSMPPWRIRTCNPSNRAAADPRLRPRGNRCRKVECNVVPVNDMKSWKGTKILAALIDGGDCSTSRPSSFTSCEKSPGTNWVEYRVRSRAGLHVFGKRNIPCPLSGMGSG